MPATEAGAGLGTIREALGRAGFLFVPGTAMRPLMESAAPFADWDRFVSSWNDLPLDTHLPDGHRYRRRRHATLRLAAGSRAFERMPHRPHYQGVEYNRLVGGIERWFEPIDPRVVEGDTFRGILAGCAHVFGELAPAAAWHVECHQFRIEARRDAAGLPTPEGVHRDGVDYVLVMLVRRENIASGTTTVHGPDGSMLGSFTLERAFDCAWVDDRRVMHGVTPVQALDDSRTASRDVLVVTFRRT